MKYLYYLPTPFVLAADLVSKSWAEGLFGGVKTLIPGVLSVRVVHNHGTALFQASPDSSLPNWLWFLLVTMAIFLIGLAFVTHSGHRLRHFGLAFGIAGASGNLISRFNSGYVVDFIAITYLPILNLADLALFCGMMLFAVDLAKGLRFSNRQPIT